MISVEEIQRESAKMPEALRRLLDAELAAGNGVEEIGHSFPAPPAGAYFKLAQPLLSRARASGDGIDYYRRNSSLYSGEITDAKRFFFLLEPAEPPPPEPDMDAIRAAHEPKARLPDHETLRNEALKTVFSSINRPDDDGQSRADTSLVGRFRRSMQIDYEKWHDGIGYDLTLLASATPAERLQIEKILLARATSDWRDVEALAELDTPAARKALKGALHASKPDIGLAVIDHAPQLVPVASRVHTLVTALRTADFYGGLTRALDQVEKFHPPKIMAELFRGALEREGGAAGAFASALLVIHGKISNRYDWSKRPLTLRFNTPERADRESAFLDLCDMLGEPAAPFAQKVRAAQQRLARQTEKQLRAAGAIETTFDVEIDAANGRLIYREPTRSATVACSFTGNPRISLRTLDTWIYTASPRSRRMSDLEKAMALGRIIESCRERHGLDLHCEE